MLQELGDEFEELRGVGELGVVLATRHERERQRSSPSVRPGRARSERAAGAHLPLPLVANQKPSEESLTVRPSLAI